MKQEIPSLDDLLRSPQAQALRERSDQVRQEAGSLLELLERKSGGNLQAAADQAGKGDPKALLELVRRAMEEPETARLAQRIRQKLSD